MKQHIAGAVLGATLAAAGFGGHHFFAGPDAAGEYAALVTRLQTEEGFRARPYRDTRGVLTIGYGTNLSEGLTRPESLFLLRSRLERNGECLADKWKPWRLAGPRTRDVLADMAYQLGCVGVLEFKKMLAALARRDFTTAAREMMDSRYARQVPARAGHLEAILLAK